MAELLVPVSPGELIDKITILEIKSQRMTDAAKLRNVRTELAMLSETWKSSPFASGEISAEWAGLRDVNGKLWDIAAAAAIVLVAGGEVVTPSGAPLFPIDLRGYSGAKTPYLAVATGAKNELLTAVRP